MPTRSSLKAVSSVTEDWYGRRVSRVGGTLEYGDALWATLVTEEDIVDGNMLWSSELELAGMCGWEFIDGRLATREL
jgi:hypothetical protein